jgi:hypothetical protein
LNIDREREKEDNKDSHNKAFHIHHLVFWKRKRERKRARENDLVLTISLLDDENRRKEREGQGRERPGERPTEEKQT